MTNNEVSAFLQQIAEKINPGFGVNISNGVVDALKAIADNTRDMLKNINMDSLRCTLLMISDVLSSIPKDVKDTAFFKKVDKFSNCKEYDLTYENIGWFLEDIRNEVLIEAADKELQTELAKYIVQIKENSTLDIREKIIVLLAHMEPLIYETLHHEKTSHDKLKIKVKEITVVNNKGMSPESLAKVYVYGICSIVFANTDNFDISIDNRIPFRNNILHNGVLSCSDDELETAYEVLVC